MIIIGTAGHIDHGKTTLVTHLTGTNTDRLDEEKARGISIELGFAYFDLPSGTRCGVIDVPGHEKFVRQMIAGAVGVDVVLLVIAADEGVMPQTREHLDICRLLGVRRGAVVLTKTDLVDDEWLELVETDLEAFVAGTFLEGQPVFRFSSQDLDQADTFRADFSGYLEGLVHSLPQRDPQKPFKLSVDRAFIMRGFGTVVTGTVANGRLRVGDETLLLPGNHRARVRGLQVHGEAREEVTAGSRAAINLQGIDADEVTRGNVLIRPDELAPVSMFDATLSVLSNLEKPVEQRSKALVHTGTAQLLGTVVLLDRTIVYPGEDALVQVRLEKPTVILPGDGYILRGFEVLANYGKTLGGGQILDSAPQKHRTSELAAVHSLEVMRDGDIKAKIEELVRISEVNGLSLAELRRRCDVSLDALHATTDELVAAGRIVGFEEDGPCFIHGESYEKLCERAVSTTAQYHRDQPTRAGIPREQLRSSIRFELGPRLFARVLHDLEQKDGLVAEGEVVRLSDFAPQISTTLSDTCETLYALYDGRGLQPPTLAEAIEEAGLKEPLVRNAIELMVRDGRLVRVRGDLCFSATQMNGLQTRLVEFLEREGEITTAQFKDLTGTSRKFSIPLGEYLDAQKITLRVGDNVRRLRKSR